MPTLETANALSRFSVAGSDGGTGDAGLLMPKLQYRFRVYFVNFGNDEGMQLTKQVMDLSRPQVQFDEITLNVYNSRLYLAGKHAWQPITVNVRDDAGGNVSRAVGAQLQKQLDFMEQASAKAGVDYKFAMQIQILDGGNGGVIVNPLETWELTGCFLQQANYQTLNYATSDAVSIALTIRFDNAVQTPIGGSINTGTGTVSGTGSP